MGTCEPCVPKNWLHLAGMTSMKHGKKSPMRSKRTAEPCRTSKLASGKHWRYQTDAAFQSGRATASLIATLVLHQPFISCPAPAGHKLAGFRRLMPMQRVTSRAPGRQSLPSQRSSQLKAHKSRQLAASRSRLAIYRHASSFCEIPQSLHQYELEHI